MRLFVAIDLPSVVREALGRLSPDPDIPDASWTRREAYHLTLRFLGDSIAEARLPGLAQALAAIRFPAFEVALRGVGRFPPVARRAARVLWVGVEPTPSLTALYAAVEEAVTGQGFPPADHPFSGHITLARLKSTQPHPSVAAFLARHAEFRALPFVADAFHLFSSTLTPQGAHYTAVATFPHQ